MSETKKHVSIAILCYKTLQSKVKVKFIYMAHFQQRQLPKVLHKKT